MESTAVRDTVANGVSVEINDAVLLRLLLAVGSTERVALGVRKLCVRCVIVCVTVEDVLSENDTVGKML